MVIISSYYDSLYSIDAAVNERSNLCSKMDIMIRGLHGVYCLVTTLAMGLNLCLPGLLL